MKFFKEHPFYNEVCEEKTNELYGDKWKTFRIKSSKKIWWKCNKQCGNHIWKTSIYNRTRTNGTSNCPFCSKTNGKVCSCGCNSFATNFPKLLKEWDYELNKLSPNKYTKRSCKKVWWKCVNSVCGKHIWEATIYDRVRTDGKHSNCPFCSRTNGKVCPCGCNSFATNSPKLLKEWDYELNELSPDKYTKSSKKKVWWKCINSVCGKHIWQATICDRVRTDGKSSNCPYCSKCSKNKKICSCSCNSFGGLYPDLLTEFHKDNIINPFEILPHSKRIRVKWMCKKNNKHIWDCSLAERTRPDRPSGCPSCAYGLCSKVQIEWLKFKCIIDNTYIQHFENKGEYKIKINDKNTKVDGYSKELNKVYEFNGDFWHGNPKIFNATDKNVFNKKTFGKLFRDTNKRINEIKKNGYMVEEMWENDWKLHKKLMKSIRN